MSEYSGYPIKQLWQMVDAAKQGLQPSHDQVAALNKAQQMLSGHAESLERARDQLAAKWPPETNAASAAYLTELDRLIIAVKDTALSCAVNVFHVNTVSDAIIQAHATLEPLHREFVENEVSLARYDAEINAFGAGASLIPGGSTVAKGAAKLFTSPPVEDGRQDELTKQAQQAMVPLTGAAQDGATYIKPPAPYAPPTVGRSIDEKSTELAGDSSSGSSGGAIQSPAIDPPAYKQHQSDSATVSPGQASGSGPTLSGYAPMPVQPAANTASPIGPSGSSNSIGQLPSGPPTIGFGTPGGYGNRLPGVVIPDATGIVRGPLGSVGPPRGGVIGNVPGVMGTIGSTPSRVNPSGSMIGQHPGVGGKDAARATGSRGSSNSAATTGSQTGQRRGSSARSKEAHWDPDNPWVLDEGVEPVILPDALPRRIDPGPGIIGIDL